MNVQYCEEHRNLGDADGCFCGPNQYCRMVPMRLIPDNAETGIDRDVLAATLAAEQSWGPTYRRKAYAPIVAAARAWLDGETP